MDSNNRNISPSEAKELLKLLDAKSPKKKSVLDEIGSGVQLAERKLAASGASFPGDILALVMNSPNYALRAAGVPKKHVDKNLIPYPSQQVMEAMEKKHGVTEPPSKTADYLTSPMDFIGGGMAMQAGKQAVKSFTKKAPAFLEKYSPKSIMDYIKLGSAGLGSKVGSELFDSPLGKVLGGLGGAFAFTTPISVAQAASKIARATPSKMIDILGYQPETHKAFKDINVDPKLSEVISSKPVKALDNLLSKLPASAGIAEKAAEKRSSQIEELVPKTYEANKVVLPEELDRISKTGARRFNKEIREESKELFDKFYSSIDPTKVKDVPKTVNEIRKSISAISPQAQEIINNSESGKLFNKFLDHLEQGMINEDKLHVRGLPYGDIKNIYLAEFNDFTKKSGDLGKIVTKEQGKVKNVAGVLKNELDEIIKVENPESVEKLAEANQHWQKYQQESKFYIDSLLNAKEGGFSLRKFKNDLQRGTTENLSKVTNSFTPDQNSILTNTLIEEFGMKNGSFDLVTAANNMNKLKPRSQDLLLRGLPADRREKFKSVIKAFQGTKSVSAEGNPSGSGFMAALAALMMGGIHKPVETLATLGASRALAKIINDPKYLDKLYEISKAKTPQQAEKLYRTSYNLFQRYGQYMNAKPKQEEQQSTSEPQISPEQATELLAALDAQSPVYAKGGRVKKKYAPSYTKKDRYKELLQLIRKS